MSYLEVGNNNQIYYEVCGNDAGIRVVFLHGGPGAGCFPHDKDMFSPESHRVLFFDQRGAGRSKPKGSILANRTENLVEDLAALMDHVGFADAIFVGGSWGSTLALLFAQKYRKRVNGLVLRGVFLADSLAIKYHFGNHIRENAESVYRRFFDKIPTHRKSDFINYIFENVTDDKNNLLREWARFGFSLARKELDVVGVENLLESFDYKSMSVIELHYFVHKFFINDNEILDNISKIIDIPTWIIHGKYDMLASPMIAEELSQRFLVSSFILTDAGHSSTEIDTQEAMIKAIQAASMYISKS